MILQCGTSSRSWPKGSATESPSRPTQITCFFLMLAAHRAKRFKSLKNWASSMMMWVAAANSGVFKSGIRVSTAVAG